MLLAVAAVFSAVALQNGVLASTGRQQAQLKFLADPSKVNVNRVVADARIDGKPRQLAWQNHMQFQLHASCRW